MLCFDHFVVCSPFFFRCAVNMLVHCGEFLVANLARQVERQYFGMYLGLWRFAKTRVTTLITELFYVKLISFYHFIRAQPQNKK